MRVSLRTQILLLVAGTVGVLSLILLGAIAVLTRIETDRTMRRDVQATEGVLGQLIRERGAALTDKCLLLANQPRLRYLRGANGATIADSLGEWLPQMHADAALLTDASGKALGATHSDIPEGSDCMGDAGVARALDGRVWTGVIARSGRLMLGVSVPVLDGASHVVLMTLSAYSEINAELATNLRQSLGSDVAFVYQGQVVGASLPLPQRVPTPQGAPILTTLGGTPYFLAYAPLPGRPLRSDVGFVTLRAYSSALQPYRNFQHALAVLLVGSIVLALASGAGLARGLTRPLDGIVKAAETLSRGDWPARFEVRRRDEIGLLQTVFNEMTEALRANQARMLALIDTDLLTGLDNHRRFQDRLAQESGRSAASGEKLALLLCDLDHFHEYNRQWGHQAGDAALKQVAECLQNCLPDTAIMARYGGEEFVVLLPQHDLAQAEAQAERLRAALRARTGANGDGERAFTLTLSVGCAEFGLHSQQGDGLVLAAELALSRAKQLGRDQVCRFDSVPGADENANPYQLHRFLKDGNLATIQALAAAVDAKDAYTKGHSQRVADYAAALAAYMGATQDEQSLIHITGTLHDVGKIGIPDAILKKPGRLDDNERTVMETHPALGEVIVKKAPQLSRSLPGVRHHHERWDGRGYPDGLAGEAIPRLARFLAVADTYDAMTSDRPYRKGLSVDIALGEIGKGAGTQFDPDMAVAFVALMRQQHNLAPTTEAQLSAGQPKAA
jgi:diguanylate cyclase (GGDEF)-like protein